MQLFTRKQTTLKAQSNIRLLMPCTCRDETHVCQKKFNFVQELLKNNEFFSSRYDVDSFLDCVSE